MARVSTVDTYPMSDDPGVRAVHASGVAVCEAFSEALREQSLTSRSSSVRVFLHLAGPPLDDRRVHVEVFDHREGFEGANAMLPRETEALSTEARAILVLDVLEATTHRLAELRGWDPAAISAARERTLERGLGFTWAGGWKASPDRRHQARAVYGIGDDGDGVAVIEIRRAGEDDPFTWSGPAEAFRTVEGFRRSARTLRWSGPGAVELVPFAGLFGETGGGVVLRTDDPPAPVEARVRPRPPADDTVARPPVVLVVKEPGHREIVAVGGGPANDVPRTWQDELDRLWDELAGPAWLAWWGPAGVARLELWWTAWGEADRVVVRRGKDKLIARIEHRPGHVRPEDGAAVARQDMADLVEAVRRREGLGEPPELGRRPGSR